MARRPRWQPARVLALGWIAGLLVAAVPLGAEAAARSDAGCVVRVKSFRFDPRSVPSGGQTQLTEAVRNCTDQNRTITMTTYGSSSGGCPVLDPELEQETIPGHSTFLELGEWTVPDCTGRMVMHLRVTGSGGRVLDTAIAVLRIRAA